MTTNNERTAAAAADFTIIPDIAGMVAAITPDSIVSRTG